MIDIDLSVEAGNWGDKQALTALARSVADAVQAELALAGDTELSLLFSDDAHVRILNRDWRGKDKATNVLSFPAFGMAPGDPLPPMLGDIAVAFETVSSEAVLEGKPFDHHLCHLIAHGLLHLLGHDHEEEEAAQEMEALECRILARLAIPDPYE